jgi:uncharacterized protein YecE (DUF72 family)
MRWDADRFEPFFALLPRDTAAAEQLARHRGRRMSGRSALRAGPRHALRHAVEIRHPSFVCQEFVDALRRHNIALVTADTAGKWPLLEDATADFAYVRLHGDQELYASGYTGAALRRWAARIGTWSHGREPADARRAGSAHASGRKRDVYCYFDNDIKVMAPRDARTLMELLKVPLRPDEPEDAGGGRAARGHGNC